MDLSAPSTTSLPGNTPSVGELSAEFARQKRAKSPPLAFERTPNDALVASVTSPPQDDRLLSPSANMGRLSPSQDEETLGLQIIVDQQANAINKLHDAFAAERQTWALEKERLYQRIASLEKLLKSGEGYSPAKSPVLSPSKADGSGSSNVTSPMSKATANSQRLPSIAEDESTLPLSQRRDAAPQSIDLPTSNRPPRSKRSSAVGFAESTPTAVKVEEIPISPPDTAKALSPPPFNNRREAGHTPLKATRPPTPPPHNSNNNNMSMDGMDDTPTRNNTHINTFLVRGNDDEEEDKELSGPLSMPELPHVPSEANFTFDMLSQKLSRISQHPEESHSRPMIFAEPSPGLASPADPLEEDQDQEGPSPKTLDEKKEEAPLAPPSTTYVAPQDSHANTSDVPSSTLSPSGMPALSKEGTREETVQADFETGGIKLKKKPSTNFGAPFGSLGGFGSVRKLS